MPAPPPPPTEDASANPAPRAERPSKTRRKQASHELQDLGEAVVALPEERLLDLALPESLLDAIRDYKRTKTFEGQRRQMQYIGKLMRRTDPEPIRQAVTDMQLGRARDSLALHQAEGWRAALLKDDEALTRWAAEHPATDVQQLRSLVRSARKEAALEETKGRSRVPQPPRGAVAATRRPGGALSPEQRNGRAYRELFQFIKQTSRDEAP